VTDASASAPSLRVAFAGTPAFAAQALVAIAHAGFTVPLVLTQPDRPAGRGMKLQASAVKQTALKLGLKVVQPAGLRLDGTFSSDAGAARTALMAGALDVMVVAAYGLILPPWVLALPRLGCLNIHGSLLPRWRGAAPIPRAIEAGDAATGITLMQMDAGLDTGAMLLDEATPIGADDTAATLHDRLADIGARLVVQALLDAQLGRQNPQAQLAAGVTYAHKITKAEAAIDWAQPAKVIERRLRAFDPFPGCTAVLAGQTVKLWRASVVSAPGASAPGQFLPTADGSLVTACGEQALLWESLQTPGGTRISAEEWRRRHAGLTP